MAANAHVTVNVYGIVEGQPPFMDATGATSFSNDKVFPTATTISLPTSQVAFHKLPNGFPVTNLNGTFYVYSVIERFPSGLNQHPVKYISDESAASLATDADD